MRISSAAERVHVRRITALDDVELLHASYLHQNFERHTHECYGFGVIEAGAMAFYYRHQNFVAEQGSINLVLPGEVHNGQAALPQGWQYRMLYIRVETLQRVNADLGMKAAALPYFPSGVIHDRELAGELVSTHALLLQPGDSILEKEYRFNHFLTNLVLRHAEDPPPLPLYRPLPQAVTRMQEYLQENYARNVSIDELCRLTGLSRFHLVRVFKQMTGVPPHAYIRQVRLRRAKELLACGVSIAETAAACGFADQSHLTRRLKQMWGYTPGAYSNSVQYT